jgi:hypothetical protein
LSFSIASSVTATPPSSRLISRPGQPAPLSIGDCGAERASA